MTDLEHRLRDILEDQARDAPPPYETTSAVRRTRRRQVLTVLAGTIAVVGFPGLSVLRSAR